MQTWHFDLIFPDIDKIPKFPDFFLILKEYLPDLFLTNGNPGIIVYTILVMFWLDVTTIGNSKSST